MAKKLMVANGKYTKDGQEKTNWQQVGVILESNGKEFMLIDPTINFAGFDRQGKDRVMVSIFEDQGQQHQQAPQQHTNYQPKQSYQSTAIDNDELPF